MGTPTNRLMRYWDRHAASFDDEPDHGLRDEAVRRAWAERLARWLPPAPALVADIACGTGSLAALAVAAGHRVVGVDLAPAMVRRAREKLAGTGAAWSGCLVGDASRPPLLPESFDAVVVRHLMWTVPDPPSALEALVALLRPGGRLVLVEGRWRTSDAEYVAGAEAMPWAGGVTAKDLAAAVRPLVGALAVEPLPEAVLWGRAVEDERYAVVAHR